MVYFSVDGIEWNLPCAIKRVATVQPSEISGMLLDKTYFNDVIGTWLEYEIAIAIPLDRKDDYTTLYEKLTDPVDAHTFVLPYNQSTVQITGRVENIQDSFVRLPGDARYWKGISFSVIADHPTKIYSLSQVLTMGRSPFPDSTSVASGSYWLYTSTNGWQPYTPPTYNNADVTRY